MPYAKHEDKKKRNLISQRERVERNRQMINDIKAINCCQDCGGKFDPCVYEFHHEVPGKYKMHMVGLNTNALLLELENCVILCANCHKLRHKHEKGVPTGPL
jgi:5-methylcytosine-specific restriction endonuclease McrA